MPMPDMTSTHWAGVLPSPRICELSDLSVSAISVILIHLS